MSVKNMNCPGCGAPVYTVTEKCPYCARLIELEENGKKKASDETLGDKLNNVINTVSSSLYGTKKVVVEENGEITTKQTKATLRFVAIILCLVFGMLGVHCFYLNRRIKGMLFLILTLTAVGALGSLFLYLVDLITLLTMSQQKFDQKYNPPS